MWAPIPFRLALTLLTSHNKGLTSLLEMYHVYLGVQQADKPFQVKGQYYAGCCYLLLENCNKTGRDKPIQQNCPVDRDGDPPLHVQSLTIT
jgi:hypothetical protein